MNQEKFNYVKEFRAIARGNKKSLQNLYKYEAPYMLAFAFKVLHHYKFAEDAVVETFGIVWDNAQYFDESLECPRGWLYAIFRFHLDASIRKNYHALVANKKEGSRSLCDECSNLYAGVHGFVEPGSFYQVFEELPEETQQALITTYFSADTLAETATSLQMPLGRLKENIHLGLRHLAQKRVSLNIKHDDVIFIGEYVLGSLNNEEKREANKLFEQDPVAEKLCLIWEDEFLNFLNQLVIEQIPETLWVRIKQVTFTEEEDATDTEELSDELKLSQDQLQAKSFFANLMIKLRKFWISRNFWRFASLALVGVIIALLIIRPLENPIRLASALGSTIQLNQIGFTVKQTDELQITPIIHQHLDDKLRLQLWHRNTQGLITYMGEINSQDETILPYNSSLKTGDMLLISIEPATTTSPSQITGQVIYQGLIAQF